MGLIDYIKKLGGKNPQVNDIDVIEKGPKIEFNEKLIDKNGNNKEIKIYEELTEELLGNETAKSNDEVQDNLENVGFDVAIGNYLISKENIKKFKRPSEASLKDLIEKNDTHIGFLIDYLNFKGNLDNDINEINKAYHTANYINSYMFKSVMLNFLGLEQKVYNHLKGIMTSNSEIKDKILYSVSAKEKFEYLINIVKNFLKDHYNKNFFEDSQGIGDYQKYYSENNKRPYMNIETLLNMVSCSGDVLNNINQNIDYFTDNLQEINNILHSGKGGVYIDGEFNVDSIDSKNIGSGDDIAKKGKEFNDFMRVVSKNPNGFSGFLNLAYKKNIILKGIIKKISKIGNKLTYIKGLKSFMSENRHVFQGGIILKWMIEKSNSLKSGKLNTKTLFDLSNYYLTLTELSKHPFYNFRLLDIKDSKDIEVFNVELANFVEKYGKQILMDSINWWYKRIDNNRHITGVLKNIKIPFDYGYNISNEYKYSVDDYFEHERYWYKYKFGFNKPLSVLRDYSKGKLININTLVENVIGKKVSNYYQLNNNNICQIKNKNEKDKPELENTVYEIQKERLKEDIKRDIKNEKLKKAMKNMQGDDKTKNVFQRKTLKSTSGEELNFDNFVGEDDQTISLGTGFSLTTKCSVNSESSALLVDNLEYLILSKMLNEGKYEYRELLGVILDYFYTKKQQENIPRIKTILNKDFFGELSFKQLKDFNFVLNSNNKKIDLNKLFYWQIIKNSIRGKPFVYRNDLMFEIKRQFITELDQIGLYTPSAYQIAFAKEMNDNHYLNQEYQLIFALLYRFYNDHLNNYKQFLDYLEKNPTGKDLRYMFIALLGETDNCFQASPEILEEKIGNKQSKQFVNIFTKTSTRVVNPLLRSRQNMLRNGQNLVVWERDELPKIIKKYIKGNKAFHKELIEGVGIIKFTDEDFNILELYEKDNSRIGDALFQTLGMFGNNYSEYREIMDHRHGDSGFDKSIFCEVQNVFFDSGKRTGLMYLEIFYEKFMREAGKEMQVKINYMHPFISNGINNQSEKDGEMFRLGFNQFIYLDF